MKAVMLLAGLAVMANAPAQDSAKPKPEDTEVWNPEPKVVAPGPSVSVAPPADATVLFDGKNLDQWVSVNDGSAAKWTVADGVMTVKKGTGNIETRERFGSYQLHLEWRIPEGISGEGQSRGNSGLFLASTGKGDDGYELQILDSHANRTYANGQAGSIYKQAAPLVNPTRAPGQWQSYDVLWRAPTFGANGAVERPARVTVLFNGIVVQDGYELAGETTYIGKPEYSAHGPSPIKLQDHGDPSQPISFRNIWIRKLD